MKKLWCYSKPNALKGHRFSDDVAICYADTFEDAFKKFSELYLQDSLIGNIKEVEFNHYGIFIATDY